MGDNATTRIFWIVTVAVVLIALGSFALSYTALVGLATSNGVAGSLAYIWPLIVDMSVIVFTGAILVSQLQRRGARLAISLTGFYGFVTIAGNLLHAPGNVLGWFVAALPPLSLIFATEMLRAMAHHSILERSAIVTLRELNTQVNARRQEIDALTRQVDAKQQQVNALANEMNTLKADKNLLTFEENSPKVDTLNAARLDAKQARVNSLLDYLTRNPHASLTEAAPVVGVSRQTVGAYVNELAQAGRLHKNGNGWEVAQ